MKKMFFKVLSLVIILLAVLFGPSALKIRAANNKVHHNIKDHKKTTESVAGWEKVTSKPTVFGEGFYTLNVDCPSGKKVVSGGYKISSIKNINENIFVYENYPIDDDTWSVSTTINSSSDGDGYTLQVYAICANNN